MPPKHLRIKCKKPMKHRPAMEGVLHCKQCAAQKVISEITGEEE